MKYLYCAVVFCFSLVVQASTVTITFSPDNPIVGQPVNFTSSNHCGFYTFDPGDGSPIINSSSNLFIHTYSTPGNYSPLMGCSGPVEPLGSTMYANSGGPVLGFPAVAAALSGSTIPTLGEWGLIILGIIIMGVGLVSMKQKRIVVSTVKK